MSKIGWGFPNQLCVQASLKGVEFKMVREAEPVHVKLFNLLIMHMVPVQITEFFEKLL